MLITKYVVQLAMWTNDKDRYEYDLFHSYSWKKTNNFFRTYLKKLISIGIDTKSIKSSSMCNIGTVIKCKNGSKIRLLITFVPEAEATVEEVQHLRKATFAVVDIDVRGGKIYIFNDKNTAESTQAQLKLIYYQVSGTTILKKNKWYLVQNKFLW